MHVIFIEPGFPANQREFVRALAQVGATVTGIGEGPKGALDDEMRHWLTHYEQVDNVCNEASVEKAVRFVQGRKAVDRMEAVVEAHIMPTANVRERCGIPGTSVKTSYLCRDKPSMKEALRAGGVPCAQSAAVDTQEQLHAFAQQVGYPLIVKPRAGAGASGATRLDSNADLERFAAGTRLGQGESLAVEEFIEGHEGFFDTLTIKGQVAHEFVSHYYPNVLEAMRTRWISPQFIATNRIDSAPGYEELKAMGRKVIEILGIETSATHMEWFFGSKGLKFSEIGCRPPGVRAWDLSAAGNDIDIYREWAMAVTYGKTSQTLSRRMAAGIIALRPDHDGQISHYDGLDEMQRAFGPWILDSHLPPAGTRTQPVEAGYMANAWVRMRHPDYDELRQMLDQVGRTVKVRAR
jgi:carbamoylphosphate synthase large subunit